MEEGVVVSRIFFILLLLTSIAAFIGGQDLKADAPRTIHVGIMASFYRDHPEEEVKTSVESFRDLMLAHTGFKGEPVKVESWDRLGEDLTKDRMQLGVFFGHEFAWAKQKYAELRPLVIVVNQNPYQRCYLLVRKQDSVSSFADFKGKPLAIARHTPAPCYLYLERKCQEAKVKTTDFFGKITHPDNVETALDDLVDGTVQALVVEEVAVNSYKRRKPGRFDRLKELDKSPTFPAAVVAYLPKSWQEDDLKTIRGALLDAHQNPEGRQLLTLWKLTGFEPVPDNYEQTLKDILQKYPPEKTEGRK
jgi:ABC-type phosphate/phosphonate transport system substrate-binding protein